MLKIIVNSHIKNLIDKYRDRIKIQDQVLQEYRNQIKETVAEIEELKRFKRHVMSAECFIDNQFGHLTMCYRISKTALKTARFPEKLFELGWKDMIHQIQKCRYEN